MAGKASTKYSKGGSDVFVIHVYGDKTKQMEPSEHRIHFPGGYIGVTRTSDDKYWVHVGVHSSYDGCDENTPGRLIGARIDTTNKSTSESVLGDLENPNLEHLAILIEPTNEFLRELGRQFNHLAPIVKKEIAEKVEPLF